MVSGMIIVMKKILLLLFLGLSLGLTSASSGKTILSDEAKEMLDDHVKQSELLKVPLPSDNRVIKDYKRFKDYRKNHLANNFHYTSYMWKEEVVKGQILTKDFCMKTIVEFKVPTTGEQKEELIFKRCLAAFMDNAVINFDDGIKLYKELLLKIATAKEDKWTYKDSGKDDFNPRDYNVWGVLSALTMFYAVNFEELSYTKDENKAIQQYLKNKAMIERFDRDGNRSRTALCDITNPMNFWRTKHKGNNCGSVRLRTAPAEMALAIVMQDQELWAKGLWDLDYTLSMIEEEGFFVPLSAKGCKALGYTWSASKLFSLNVEMLKLADFNLLDYKTRHGKTIAEAYEMLFKQYEDITISNHIAKKGFGAVSCGVKPYKTHEEFVYYEFGSNPDQFAEAVKENWVPKNEDWMNWSIRFVSEKHPEWLKDKYTLRDIKVNPWLGQYFHVQPFEIFNANTMSESTSIWQEKNKELELRATQEFAACKDSKLNGEYKATWIFVNVNDSSDVEIMGSEKLVFENCIGQFEGVDSFQPSKELRENLQVTLTTNGQITISGHIDLWDVGHSYPTVLSGDINSGEISGIWEEGDLIKIKIVSQKEIEEKQIRAASELSIFEFEGETFNIKLDKVDFIATEPSHKQKINNAFELHKAFIQGSLRRISNKKIDFKTVAFKQDLTNEERLVIYVGDDRGAPEMNLFTQHRDSLEKKCGSDLMNEWGWLSFISETTDIEQARKQQCHYDYFKEANDKQAWELFQAVLGGTNSILSYLQTNNDELAKQKEERNIQDTSKLYIFKIEGETFNLALDNVDFIETKSFELERNEKYLHPFQLHKGFIYGSLIKEKVKIDFSTLVFKQADPQEQRLVIHIDDWTVEPFKRHSDSLQKKCGSELMNEWGWLSFISETTDTEKASEQQCHYDYFKEANDKEAWELFQIVLGGTDSILDYLQINVEQ